MAKIIEKVKELFKKPEKAKKEEEKDKDERLDVQFSLAPDKETQLIDYIKACVDDTINSRSAWTETRRKAIRLYEGITQPKTKPWPGACSISTMVTTVACDLLHAKLYPMAWNPDTIYWQGREKNDTEIAENIRTLMGFATGPSEMNFGVTVDDILHMLIVDGTIATKERWDTYWTYVTRVVPKPLTATQILNNKLEYEVVYDYVKRERCYADLKPIDRIYFPYEAIYTNDENELDFIIEETYFTLAQLKEMKAKGYIRQDLNLDELKIKMDDLPEFKGVEGERANAEGSVAVNTRKENYKLKCFEAYIKYDVNDDDIREECVFFVCTEPRFYFSGKPLHAVSRIGKRPWTIRPFLRRPGRTLGKSIPELTMNLHEEMDAIHQQRIDAGNMAIAPFFFFRPAAGMSPSNITVGPATGVPVDDPDRDIRFPQFPSFGLQVSFQEERIVMELIERLTFLTPAMMGKEVASRPTVRGTLAVMSQGEQKFALLARRVQEVISAILTQVKQKYEENYPPDLQARILGKQAEQKTREISVETIAGQYDCVMQLDLTAGNLGMERELNTIVYQTMAFDPFVQQNPEYGWEVRADYLRSMNKKNVERIIGPKPQLTAKEGDAEDIFYRLLQESQIHPGKIDAKVLNRLLELKDSDAYKNANMRAQLNVNRYIQEAKIAYVEQMEERMTQYADTFGRQGGEAEGLRGAEGFAGPPGMGGARTLGSTGPTGQQGANRQAFVPGQSPGRVGAGVTE